MSSLLSTFLLSATLLYTAHGAIRQSKFGCEGTLVHLECDEGEVISPVRANFGRFNPTVCNPEMNTEWSTRCIQPTSLRQVNSICEGKTACTIDVTSSVFGDPCPGTYKYLEVHYTCQTEVVKPRTVSNLPPWLLAMSATTRRPTPPPSTTPAPSPSSTPSVEELLFPGVLEDLLNTVEDMEEDQEDENIPEPVNEVFINLPLEDPEVQNLEIEEERTVLVATLTSVLSCSVIIFVAAVLYTRLRRTVKQQDAQVQDYIRPASIMDYECYDNSSGSSTVSSLYTSIPNHSSAVGSVYTTLPNGDRAIIIPLPSNPSPFITNMLQTQNMEQNQAPFQQKLEPAMLHPQQLLQQHHFQQQQQQQLLQQLNLHQQQQENIYIDIDENKRRY